MAEKSTGVFGAVDNDEAKDTVHTLVTVSEDDPNSIYSLLFKKYDEENNG